MPARRREPEWTRPSDAELPVLRKQIERGIADGEALMSEPFREDGRWSGWHTTLVDLLHKAFGPDRWPSDFEMAGNVGGVRMLDSDYMSEEEIAQTRGKERSRSIGA